MKGDVLLQKVLPSRYQRYNVLSILECDCENYLLRIIARNLRYEMHARLEEVILFSQNRLFQKGFEGNTYEFLTAPQPKDRSLMDEMRKKAGPLLPLPFRSAIYIHDLLLKNFFFP